MKESGFKRLVIWHKGIEIAREVYELTKRFPSEERFGLVTQMRRAAISVPSNIAEGYSRRNDREFKQFLYIALGSLAELETQLILSNGFGWIRGGEVLGKKILDERFMILKICHKE